MASQLNLLLSVLLPRAHPPEPKVVEPAVPTLETVRHPQLLEYGSVHRPSIVERMATRERAEHRKLLSYD